MNREEIKQFLPHREPMLLVDEASVDAEGVCHGTYRIPEDAYFCQGHFPDNPIVPGVILCEIMAQSCCLFVREELLQGRMVVYRGLDQVKFRSSVHPGDECRITGRLLEKKGGLTVCEATLSVAGRRCCQAVITLAAVARA